MGRGMKRFLTRAALVTVALAAIGVGLRQFIHSRIHLLGDSVIRIETSEKVVALSFDDGPHPTHTPRMLDLLDRHAVKASFFMMGRNVERWPDTAREVLRRGHEVGNHSYSHPRLIFMSPARVRAEIERTDALLRGIGVVGPIQFSPPHGAKLVILPYVLRQMGKIAVYSDTDAEEWKRPPAAVMVESVMSAVGPGSVIGFHDTAGDETLRAVDEVVSRLLAAGYRFVRVSELAAMRPQR
jgi:peptidoglycan/xylan/chitin deacetylase (PgdA/CDA1 family)